VHAVVVAFYLVVSKRQFCCFASVFNVRFIVVPEHRVLFGETEIENKGTEREQEILGSRFLRCC
jgi:hypothetical protein